MSSLDGTSGLVRLAVRRDRVRLTVWVLVLLALTWFSADAMGTTFPTQASIDAYADSVAGSPAVIALAGPPLGLHTLAGIVLNKVWFTSVLGVTLVAVLTVVRHTRGEEEEGRGEMLRATVVGRHAASAAALTVSFLVSVVIGVGTALALHAATVPTTASWLFGASVAALGIVFAGVTLVLAQLFTHARASLGVALAVLAAAYVVRAAGDVRDDWLVWLSPVGWSQATHPLGDERWWPLLVPLAATAGLVAVAVVLTDHRDVGAGLVAARRGAASGTRWLAGPVGLAFRLQRASLIGWAVGLFVLSAAVGSLSREVTDMARDNPALTSYLAASGSGSMADTFFATMLVILSLIASAFAVSSALRTRAEETSGRLEALLSTGLSRTRWLLGSLVVTLTGTLLLLAVSGLGLGLSYALVVPEAEHPLGMTWWPLVYAPAALVPAALAALLVGWAPRAGAVCWAALGFCFVIGWLGGLLHPPHWLEQLSPFSHTPAVPVQPVAFDALSAIALFVVLLVGGGMVGLRRRDIG